MCAIAVSQYISTVSYIVLCGKQVIFLEKKLQFVDLDVSSGTLKVDRCDVSEIRVFATADFHQK